MQCDGIVKIDGQLERLQRNPMSYENKKQKSRIHEDGIYFLKFIS